MNQAAKKDLLKYIGNVSYGLLGFGAFLSLTGAVGTIRGVDTFSYLMYLALGLFCMYFPLRNRKVLNDYFNALEESAELQLLLRDFAQSKSMVDDRIRVGREYTFGKKQGVPVRYFQMRKVYQHIYKHSFFENERRLMCEVENGKTVTLCILKLRGKSDEDVAKIMGYIRYRNPNVHLGHR